MKTIANRESWRMVLRAPILFLMRWFRLLWLVHRWLGIAAGLVLLLSALTGFLLLFKKEYAWLQPPITVGTPGPKAELQPLAAVIDKVVGLGLPQFSSEADIARIDFRPQKGVHKVISEHDDCEVQVCAITLATSPARERRSDWLESLHDGSALGGVMHGTVMPIVALVLLYLGASGYVMWLWPKWLRRRRAGQAAPS